MDYFIPLAETYPSLSNCTLLLPQPSLGSVAQLACDLIISTLQFKLIGYLNPKDYVPSVSGRDSIDGQSTSEGICYGVEVFQNQARNLIIILPRSPIIRKRKNQHCEAMNRFIQAARFKQVLLIAGLDADTRQDDDLTSDSPLRYFDLTSTAVFPTLEKLTPAYAPKFVASPTNPLPAFPCSGVTRDLLLSFSDSPTPISTLLIFATEGDNSSSAFYLAGVIAEAVGLVIESKWTPPASWSKGLMGEPLNFDQSREMYG